MLLEDKLHARGINLHILTGICVGLHQPDGNTIADRMLFMVAVMAAGMERDLTRGRNLDGLRAAQAQGQAAAARHRSAPVTEDLLAIARARREQGEPVTAVAGIWAWAGPRCTGRWTWTTRRLARERERLRGGGAGQRW